MARTKFRFENRAAKTVALAGDFNGWGITHADQSFSHLGHGANIRGNINCIGGQ